MKIFLDFDDVLFNTKAFRNDLMGIFRKNGVSRKDFLASYKDYPTVSRGGLKKYDPFKQIELLEKKFGIDGKKIAEDLGEFLASCPKYIFRDVKAFLKQFSKRKLYLISYGHTGFQDKKIDNSGISPFFQKIVVTDKMKAIAIRRFAKKDETLIFLEDRTEQINEIKKYFSRSITFLVKRKEGRYADKRTKYVDYEVRDLREASKVLRQLN